MAVNRKRGQVGLVDVFSYIMYFLAVTVVIFLLNIYGSVNKNTQLQKSGIQEDVNLANAVRADSQLDSMLRTRIDKDSLFNRLDWMKSYEEQDFASGLNTNFNNARAFLESHPELTTDKDYSGFISGLHAIYVSGDGNTREDASQAFTAVTGALFMRVLKKEVRRGRGASLEERTWYYLPSIGIDFNPENMLPASGSRFLCNKDPDVTIRKYYELAAEYVLPSGIQPCRDVAHAVQAVPLADSSIAKVDFGYYPETQSTLPKP